MSATQSPCDLPVTLLVDPGSLCELSACLVSPSGARKPGCIAHMRLMGIPSDTRGPDPSDFEARHWGDT